MSNEVSDVFNLIARENLIQTEKQKFTETFSKLIKKGESRNSMPKGRCRCNHIKL